MKNTLNLKKQSTTSKCKMCGKAHKTRWQYCSNECVDFANKRAYAEYQVLRRIQRNLELRKKVFLAELIAEGQPLEWDIKAKRYFEAKHEQECLQNGII